MTLSVLPLTVVREMLREQTGEVFPFVMTIEDVSFPAPLYLTDSAEDWLSHDPVRKGFMGLHDYVFALPVPPQLPDLKPGSPLATTIIIDNIEDDYRTPIANAVDPRVSIAMVMGSAPTQLLYPRTGLFIVSRSYDEESVTIGISDKRIQGHGGASIYDPLIKHRQTKSIAPGLHR